MSKGYIVVMTKRKNYRFKIHNFFCIRIKDTEDGPDGVYINKNKQNFGKIAFLENIHSS